MVVTVCITVHPEKKATISVLVPLALVPIPVIGFLDNTIILLALAIIIPTLLALDTANRYIDFGRDAKPKCFTDFGEIEVVDVKDLFERI